MQSMYRWTATGLFVALVGCTDDAQRVTVESNDLGIATVEIRHERHDEYRDLSISGFDALGAERATLTLRVGRIWYESEWAPAGFTLGTDLTLVVGDQQHHHVVPDLQPHKDLEPGEESLAAFLRIDVVAGEIDHEAGIQFSRRTVNEIALSAVACTAATFQTNLGSPTSCCQDGVQQYFKIPSGTNAGKLGTRQLGATACRMSDGNPFCEGANSANGFPLCTYGPCRGDAWGATGTTGAKVFTPNSAPTRCGFDDNGATSGGSYWPEPYVSQAVKPGVTATCGYINCCVSCGYSRPSTAATCPHCTGVGQFCTSNCNCCSGYCSMVGGGAGVCIM